MAPAAFGGSALVRALAALPVALDAATERRPFRVTALGDIALTACAAAARWRDGWPGGGETWDVMSPRGSSVGSGSFACLIYRAI